PRTRRATVCTRSGCAAGGTPRRATRSSTGTRSRPKSCSPVTTPSPGPMGAPFGAGFNPTPTRSPAHLLAGARAYNRWAAQLCQDSPERRAGLIVAPILDDLDGAITEIRRAHGEGLTGGIIIPPRWTGHESYT